MLNAVCERTWGARPGRPPATDYWREIIPPIRREWPEFLFIAEAYWDLEWELQQQGFDYCYDKRLYDRLVHGGAQDIRLHLLADPAFQEKLVRFIENHDEPRAAATFPSGKTRAAAVVALTLAGARLLHEGQLEGRKIHVPIFLGRRPEEPVDRELATFYRRLLNETNRRAFRNGRWHLCEQANPADTPTQQHIVAWCWVDGEERFLIVVNLSEHPAEARVQVPIDELRGRTWHLVDTLSGEAWERSGDAMREGGLHVALGPWGFHFLSLRR
jgi:hypothetical protein